MYTWSVHQSIEGRVLLCCRFSTPQMLDNVHTIFGKVFIFKAMYEAAAFIVDPRSSVTMCH